MTTSELIAILQKHEFGGATGKPRNVNLKIPGYGFLGEPTFSIVGTGDGLYTDICFEVVTDNFYPEEKEDEE